MQALITLVLILGIPALATAQRATGEINGTIRVNGCFAEPAHLQLRASPVNLYTPTERGSRAPGAGELAMAKITKSRVNPREFAFQILVSGERGHRLGIRLTSPDCPRVTWTGPPDGIVIPDGPPVMLEAFAIRTELEILGEGMGRPGPEWVGADHLDFTDPAVSARRLRVRSTLPGITEVVLQLSTRPYPASGRTACEENPPEVIRSMQFPVRGGGGWLELPPVDFRDLLQGRRDARDSVAEVPPLDPLVLRQLELGAPIYLRALPVGTDPDRPADGPRRLCDPVRHGLSGWVRVVKLAKILEGILIEPQQAIKLYSAVYKGPQIAAWPGAGEVCYTVTQKHTVDPSAGSYDFLLVLSQKASTGTQLKPGDGPYCFDCCASDNGWFESFTTGVTDLVTGAVDWVSGLVNWAAKVYDSVKGAVGDVIVGVITSVGIPCDATCKSLVQTGIEIGLSSMGMPPDLPNWDELKEEGLDYVASHIASQTGIPPEVSGEALKYATETVKQVSDNRGGGGGLPDWLAKDFGLKPAVLTLTLRKTTEPWVPLPPMILRTIGNQVYFPGQLPLPNKFPLKPTLPGDVLQLLKVPMVLNPNIAGLPPCPYCNLAAADPALFSEWTTLWYKLKWSEKLKPNPCVPFFQTGWTEGPFGVPLNPFTLYPFLQATVFTTTVFNPPLPDSGMVSLCYP